MGSITRNGSLGPLAVKGSESSGRRRPIGESPGSKNSLVRANRPRTARPAWLSLPPLTPQRQYVADRRIHPLLKDTHQTRTLFGIFELGVGGVDVDRQLSLAYQEVSYILECGHNIVLLDIQFVRQGMHENLRVFGVEPMVFVGVGDQ